MRNNLLMKIGFCVLAVLLWGKVSRASATILDKVYLVVDREAMTRGEMEEAVNDFFQAQQTKAPAPGTPAYEKVKQQVVEGFIREVLLAEEADRMKIDISDGEVDHAVDQEIDGMKKQFSSEQEFDAALKSENISMDELKGEIHDKLLRRIKASRVIHYKQEEQAGGDFVSDAEIKKYYDAHPNDYAQVKFAIILFQLSSRKGSGAVYAKEVEKQAAQLLAQLKSGADFAVMAKKYSEDSGTADKGGEVGTVYRSDLDPKLAEGIFKIPVKGLGIVRTEKGVYIVKVEFRGPADYATVAPAIKDHLQKDKQSTFIEDWIAELRKKASITEDGKVISVASLRPAQADQDSTGASSGVVGGTTPNTGTAAAPATPVEAVNNTPSAVAAATPETYPSLPAAGTFDFYLGADGFNFGSKDLINYFPSGTVTTQDFPFGYQLKAGLDWALASTFQVGIEGQYARKFTETVNDLGGLQWKWDPAAVGPLLSLRLLVPMNETTNFTLSAAGGYYFLLGSTLSVTGTSKSENADLDGSAWGGQAAAGLEVLLDDSRSVGLDFGVSYRLLNFPKITPTVKNNTGGPALGSPLTNSSDGSQAALDFSGVQVGASLRFYLDKD